MMTPDRLNKRTIEKKMEARVLIGWQPRIQDVRSSPGLYRLKRGSKQDGNAEWRKTKQRTEKEKWPAAGEEFGPPLPAQVEQLLRLGV
ncbi:MAG TPA: hypothetical protein VGK22_24050 [Candidatus Angelobacter sp.]|jgi:hypothetical protein